MIRRKSNDPQGLVHYGSFSADMHVIQLFILTRTYLLQLLAFWFSDTSDLGTNSYKKHSTTTCSL